MFDLKKYELEMDKGLEFFRQKLNSVRTGRAHPDMLDDVKVEEYGTILPLTQTANIVANEAMLITVTPFDSNNLQAITKAIRNDRSLGLNPSDNGKVILVPIPSLTEERRREIVKQTSEKVEEARVGIRNSRQDAIKDIKRLKEDKKISEDDAHRFEKEVQSAVDKVQDQIEQIFKDKEKELMTV